jgi:hypothetical protein
MKTFRLRLMVSLAGLAIAISGCVSRTSDVTRDDSLWGGYHRQKEYVLLRDVFAVRVDGGMPSSKKLALVPEASLKRGLGRHYMSPNSIEEYKKNPKEATTILLKNSQVTMDVAGILPVGTRLKLTELQLRSGWAMMVGSFKDLTPWAVVMDGSFAGASVDITDISIYYRNSSTDPFMYRPEAGVISRVDAN